MVPPTGGEGREGKEDRNYVLLRSRMVENQLRARGIGAERVLQAMDRVPRHLFVPEADKTAAYEDRPLPVGLGQTISQPYIVARMTELLEPQEGDRVLEVGTGSGYQAAILGELVAEVWTIERHSKLARGAEQILKDLGYDNVTVVIGDGTLGLSAHSPYDGIIVTAGAPDLPQSLLDQLAPGGRMVIPTGDFLGQSLRLVRRTESGFQDTKVLSCQFVPLIGNEGYEG